MSQQIKHVAQVQEYLSRWSDMYCDVTESEYRLSFKFTNRPEITFYFHKPDFNKSETMALHYFDGQSPRTNILTHIDTIDDFHTRMLMLFDVIRIGIIQTNAKAL